MSNDDVITVNNHVIKMAAVTADDSPNTVRIRIIVPDIKFQVIIRSHVLLKLLDVP